MVDSLTNYLYSLIKKKNNLRFDNTGIINLEPQAEMQLQELILQKQITQNAT
jgi:hypothetical protein